MSQTLDVAPTSPGIAPNAHRLLWAGFMAILAAGVGFAIRGGILDNWGSQYGFTAGQLGRISAQGLTGFCFGVIIGGIVADKIGYGKLVIVAFLLHIVSAVVTLLPGAETSSQAAYNMLFWGSFLFALANGTLEAVANPLVATLFPNNRTHYLNILHASWPAGLVIGTVIGYVLDDQLEINWKYQWAVFLIPAALYGVMFIGQIMPKSEAALQGLSLPQMLKDVGILGGGVISFLLAIFFIDTLKPLFPAGADGVVSNVPDYIGYIIAFAIWALIAVTTKFSLGSILLFVLFVTHAMVGAVELGTDGWIQNITGNLFTSEQGKFLFIFTSAIMFGLRFCAHFIEKTLRLSPIGLLLVCAVLAFIGLNLTSGVQTIGMAFLALGIYALGKTFFWPTMIAVASDRFPATGAVAISIMGGIGMMSGGLLGATGLGYFKDRYASQALQEASKEPGMANLYSETKADKPTEFLFFDTVTGLDGEKLGEAKDQLTALRKSMPKAQPSDLPEKSAAVLQASIQGDRDTLKTDSALPATMAVIYLGLMIYFASIGGYKVLSLIGNRNQERLRQEAATGES